MSLTKQHLYLNGSIITRAVFGKGEKSWTIDGTVYDSREWDFQVLFTPKVKPPKEIEGGDRVKMKSKLMAAMYGCGVVLFIHNGYAWVAWDRGDSSVSGPMTCQVSSLELADD